MCALSGIRREADRSEQVFWNFCPLKRLVLRLCFAISAIHSVLNAHFEGVFDLVFWKKISNSEGR